ncbi:hypothetical protein [Trinickia symbiotica]|uniref:Uncharacterized protein n=1 Tax=Trinickia symbiotica TaxID=863227 RepID=A0A2N7XA20_9BURK|nr:hypothetical protein [Trinickia symbiotica]PMS38461.1 hypothetical protein C0Z20_00825 [Trinickia symbiotica]
MKANNVMMGLGVAVLGFALVQYFRARQANASTAALNATNAGATWQNLTFPSGDATGGVNSMLNLDQIYASPAWNPDALSSALGNDALGAMQSTGNSTANTWGFTL